MGQDSKGEDWEDNSRHAGDAVGSMASEAERTSWGSRSTSSSLEARAAEFKQISVNFSIQSC